jgi:hypothetical protein
LFGSQLAVQGWLGKDTVSVAPWITDEGHAAEVAGISANTYLPPFAAGAHAVLWEKDVSTHDLGNLGKLLNTSVPGQGSVALAIKIWVNPG